MNARAWTLPLVAAVVLAVAALLAADRYLAASPDDWALLVRVGPLARRWQAAKVARALSARPVAWLLDGASLQTASGRWKFARTPDGTRLLRCAPCRVRHRAIGPAAVSLKGLTLAVRSASDDAYAGRLWVDGGGTALAVDWEAHLRTDGVTFDARAAGWPIADAFAVLAAALPDLARARIEGRLAFQLHYRGRPGARSPEEFRFEPVLDGFVVEGLGTEALLNAQLPPGCGTGGMPLRGYLPRAVLAAEDQRFYAHPGYEVPSLQRALLANAGGEPGTLQGGSTLTQQLAKLLFTGDARDGVRKLRELAYAAEMERTLGKARILQLYLSIAPWGQGICGAEAAARRYLDKPASAVDPLEAAWLASLLHNPDRDLARMQEVGGIDRERTRWVLLQMRPMGQTRRERALQRLESFHPTNNTHCPGD